jgi:WD40 repeat protein
MNLVNQIMMSNNFLVRQIIKTGSSFFVNASIAILTLCPIVLTSVLARADNIYTTDIPKEAIDDIKNINNRGITAKSIAFTPNGGYVILYGKNGFAYSTNNLPQQVLTVLTALRKQDLTINTIAFTPNGEWIIIYKHYYAYSSKNFTQNIIDKISETRLQLFSVNNIAFAPNGAFTIVANLNVSQVYWNNKTPQNLVNKIKEILQTSTINSIAFTPNGGWIIIFDKGNNALWYNIPQLLSDTIKARYKEGKRLTGIAFAPSNGWVLLFGKSIPPSPANIPTFSDFPPPIVFPQ